MTMDAAMRGEVQKLCAALCDGAITADQLERLETLVHECRDARRMYIETINLHAALKSYNASQSTGVPDRATTCRQPAPAPCTTRHQPSVAACVQQGDGSPVPEPLRAKRGSGIWRRNGRPGAPPDRFRTRFLRVVRQPLPASLLVAGAFFVAVLLVLGIIPLPNWQTTEKASVAFRAGAPRVEVATLSGTQGCRWDAAGLPVRVGERLYSGQHLTLARGVVQITCDDNARILLEGPATYVVDRPGRGYLERGRATASVPAPAVGFTIETPSAILIDQGTEFGVSVDGPDLAEVYVFDGVVEAELIDQVGPTGRKVQLLSGRAARFDSRLAKIERIDVAGRRFVRKIDRDDAAAVAQRQRNAFAHWQRRNQDWRQDPSLVAYYTFDSGDENSRRLVNRAAATAGHLQGVLGNRHYTATWPIWTTGRWPNKGALAFAAGLDQRVHVDYDEGLLDVADELSIVACVRLSHGGTVLLNRNARKEHMHYQLGVFSDDADRHAGTIQFGIGTGKRSKGAFVYSDPVVPARRCWQHVAVTCQDRTVRFYLNGKPAGARTVETSLVAKNADMLIGQGVDPSSSDKSARAGFDGRMDELAIFHRVLAPEEIASIAEAGKKSKVKGRESKVKHEE